MRVLDEAPERGALPGWPRLAGGLDSEAEEAATVLIVDDTPTNLQVLLDALESAELDVLVATSGQQALERAELGAPDLVLLDVVMPGMDGFETCRRMKSTPALRDTPVIFMTALDATADKLNGFEAGAVDYVTKPLDHDEVITRVRTHLALRRLSRDLETQNLQLGAIGEALTRFLRTDSSSAAMTVLLESAVAQTASDLGFAGVTAGADAAGRVRVLALAGRHEDLAVDRAFYESLGERLARDGHADYPAASLEAHAGRVLEEARPVPFVSRDDGEGANGAAAYGLSVPLVLASEVAGFITLVRSGRAHAPPERKALERFAATAAAVLECERLRRLREESEHQRERAEEQARYLNEELALRHNFDEVAGNSEAIRKVLAQVERVARTDSTVLVRGETGTGKELIARAIHGASQRAGRPLICVSCAALPEGLVESELFGHEKGAFTGAAAQRKGRFELADGGTLFLDEIGDMPLPAQAKLLRVLQEQALERVGGNKTIRVDVRVLAATHRELEQQVAAGEFRQDLYYRLNVFPIDIPPLRERREDIGALAAFFARRFASEAGLPVPAIPRSTLERLRAYDWPGNVRELGNVMERAVILCADGQLEVPAERLAGAPAEQGEAARQDAPGPAPAAGSAGASQARGAPTATLEEVEREYVARVLEHCGWAIAGPGGAAQILGLNPSTLRNRIAKLGLKRPTSPA